MLIDATPVPGGPWETLPRGALRRCIDFPRGCRVGCRATCKCKLVEGRAGELTRMSGVLSAGDLEDGCMPGCEPVIAKARRQNPKKREQEAIHAIAK